MITVVIFLGSGQYSSGLAISQIFVRDIATGTTELVSENNDGQPANQTVGDPSISGDGRFIAFQSSATNLVNNDTNGVSDVFVRDRVNGTTTRITAPSNSDQANGVSSAPYISGNGQYIVFSSSANNLVPNDTNSATDVFRYNIQTGSITRISVNSNNEQAICTGAYLHNCHSPSSSAGPVSNNGRYVLFQSRADNLTQIPGFFLRSGTYANANQLYIRDTITNTTTLVSETYTGTQSEYGARGSSLTDNGKYVVFGCGNSADGCGFVPEGDNGIAQLYLRDTVSGVTTKVSVNNSNVQGNASVGGGLISSDGETILFSSSADNLDTNEISGLPNIFTRNLAEQTTARVSLTNDGTEINGGLDDFVASPDNRFIAFSSDATNIVSNNNPGEPNVFLLDRFPDSTPPIITGTPDSQPNTNGWYNHNVNINWSSTDPSPSSGTPTQPPETVASLEGAHTYTSEPSCDPAGNCATGSLNLKIDKINPTISYTITPTPNNTGWNKSNAIVNFNCNDTVSGIATCTQPITVSNQGTNQTATGTAIDKAGNTASVTAYINIDKTPPTTTNPAMSGVITLPFLGSFLLSNTPDLSANASDNLSGVTSGEYYVDTDPGEGNGAVMTYSSGQLSAGADFTDLNIGIHTLYIRSQGTAGNWGTAASLEFWKL